MERLPNLQQQQIIDKTIEYVKTELSGAEGGHDWWHIYRVWRLAETIAQAENADRFVVQLGALLHDIADSKFHDGDEETGPRKAREFLQSIHVEEAIIGQIEQIVANISFHVGSENQVFHSPELNIIQDADRLDAIGAIGIARAFNYGGFKNREMYNPDIMPRPDMSREAYRKNSSPTINHFYEKLLKLKELMNTKTGKKMALRRHAFMEQFLEEFSEEWEGRG